MPLATPSRSLQAPRSRRNRTCQVLSTGRCASPNRLASIQRGKQQATSLQYDRGGNLRAVIDPLGRVTTAEFDKLDRMAKAVLPPAAPGKPATSTGYGFDHQDSVVSVTDPRRLTTRYTRDGYGQQRALNSPDTSTTTYDFDGAGNLVSSRDARGIGTAYRYDAARRVTKIGTSTFEYGKEGSSATGRLTAMTDDSGKSKFAYDGYGRLQTQVHIVGSGPAARQFSLGYKYGTSGGGTGHVTTMTYPSGNRIDVTYGADGLPSALTLSAPGSTAQTAIISNIRHSALGAVQGWTWGTPASKNVYRRQFDAQGRIKSYPLGSTVAGGALRTVNYDDGDRIKSIVHTGAPNANRLDQRYTYDDQDRLTRVEGANVSQAFGYDANGNRVQARFGSGIYTNTILASSNRLANTSGPAPAKTNTYDNAGNLTSDGTAKYTYGTNGRLMAVDVAEFTTSYRINAFGQRVAKAGAGGSVTFYVYDREGHLVGEYDQVGEAMQETVYLGDLPVAVLKRSGGAGAPPTSLTDVYGVFADHILTPRVIARLSDNRIVWRWDNADPFGIQQPDESPSGLPKFTYNPRFPGQVYDRETNSHYNYFRDYDPQTGRYVQSDPIGLHAGINTYAYVGANPVFAYNSTGLICSGGPGFGAHCTVDSYAGKGQIPATMRNAISRLELNMTQAYQDAMANPTLKLLVNTNHGPEEITGAKLADRMRMTRVSVLGCADTYGKGAAARSPFQRNEILVFNAAFEDPATGTPISDWGQRYIFDHEMLHQFPKINSGTVNHQAEFDNALRPLVGPGSFY
jgi:RHS repeat-associated protein